MPASDWLPVGIALGVGAMGGDLLERFVKRRRGIAPSARWIPADPLDFVVGALALVAPLLAPPARPSWADVGMVLAVSFVGDVLVDHAAYALHVRETAW